MGWMSRRSRMRARISVSPGVVVGGARLTGQQYQHSSPYGGASNGREERAAADRAIGFHVGLLCSDAAESWRR